MGKSLLMHLFILSCCLKVLSGSLPRKVNEVQYEVNDEHNSRSSIVQCRTCHFQFPGEKCHIGRGVCTASENEACVVGKVFKKDGTPWLIFMDCIKQCANVVKSRWGSYLIDFKCCRGSDLCNEKLV